MPLAYRFEKNPVLIISLTRSVVGLRSCDTFVGDFSHTLLVLHEMFRTRFGLLAIKYPSSNGGGCLRCSHD